jgi:hypothetical protein
MLLRVTRWKLFVVLVRNLNVGKVPDCGKLRGEATNLKPLLVEKMLNYDCPRQKKRKKRTGY